MAEPQTTTEPTLEPCPLAHEVREGVNLWSSSAGQKWHIWCYDCGLQFEGRLNQPKDEVIKAWSSRVSVPSIAPVVDEDLLTPLDEIESALISIAEGTSPEDAVRQAFDVINRERLKLSAAPASTVAPQEQSDETPCPFSPDSELYWPIPVSSAAPSRSVEHLVNHWQAAWLSVQYISRDSEVDLIRRIEAFISPAALRDEAEQCYWCKHPDHRDKVCPVPYLARGEGGIVGSYPCGCSHSTVIATTPATAAAKIADQLIPHLDHAFLLTKGWRDQIASIIEGSLSSGS